MPGVWRCLGPPAPGRTFLLPRRMLAGEPWPEPLLAPGVRRWCDDMLLPGWEAAYWDFGHNCAPPAIVVASDRCAVLFALAWDAEPER